MAKVSIALLCIFVAAQGDDAATRLDVPDGFSSSLYASGIDGAHDLDVRADGTITLRGAEDLFEISPRTADQPVTVMRVAAELATSERDVAGMRAAASTHLVRLRWNARSGEIAYVLMPAHTAGVAVSAQTLALARHLKLRRDADVAMAPDGGLFVADSRAGAVWHIRRASL